VEGSPNVIASNVGPGVAILGTATGNVIAANSIDNNGGLGIDLGLEGVTANDTLDPDAGPNTLQNHPVITSAITNFVGTITTGTLNSTPNTTFGIHLYGSPAADPSGFGEGRIFLEEVNVTTDAAGNATFTIPSVAIPVGQVVSATATGPGGTSEFSRAVATVPVSAPPQITISDRTAGEGNAGTTAFTFTVTLSAASTQPVTVSYATANGTAGNADYTAASGTVTFPAGDTSETITINVTSDTVVEPDETFFVNLSGPTNATIADHQGQGTITNDDAAAAATDVPTLSEWALIVVAGLLALLALRKL
jgi:hypothetical protein